MHALPYIENVLPMSETLLSLKQKLCPGIECLIKRWHDLYNRNSTISYTWCHLNISVFLFLSVNSRNAIHAWNSTHFDCEELFLDRNFMKWKIVHPSWDLNPRTLDYVPSVLTVELRECDTPWFAILPLAIYIFSFVKVNTRNAKIYEQQHPFEPKTPRLHAECSNRCVTGIEYDTLQFMV